MNLKKNEWRALYERIMLTLRPTQFPIAMKFIRTQEEFDKINNVEFCQNKASACRLIGMASHFHGTFGLTSDHFSGYYCATNNGCWPIGQQWLDGGSIYTAPICWHHNQEDAIKHIAENIKQLPKEPYIGMVCASLNACEIEEADVICLQLPTQAAFHLLAGFVENDYQQLIFTYSGESNCSDTWMRTLKEGKIGLSLGCRGDRATGGLGYGDVRISMTTQQLIKALDGVDIIAENGIDYPYNPTCMLRSAF